MKRLIVPLLVILALGCSKEDSQNSPESNVLSINTSQGISEAVIGRVLFYDTRLSENNAISCASCHKQANGFSDNVALSKGFQGHRTTRNSIAITAPSQGFTFCGPAISSTQLFWDGRESNLGNMVVLPVLNHVEMGMSDRNALVQRVKNAGYYRELFNSAGITDITLPEIANCLQQFVLTLNNGNSKFDQFVSRRGQLSSMEQEGQRLFFDVYPCGSCHTPQSGYFIDESSFIDIGLDNNPSDIGRAGVSGSQADVGKFKVPSLKNVALSAPYMHDGRFQSLDEVLEHYSHGIKNDPNLDVRLKSSTGTPMQFNFTDSQKKSLIAFLNTLTDIRTVSAEEYSDPFKR